ncbi:CBS domain-containing protein [Waterburya agarophytonicola K14]|uniref:CBS domain-containing protein n=1 Tax=Waterburya agarophytonicola KI4 TaxID=2874699 RepID=A0A964BNW5_9CYAN|nr:CBS domain-containing protein [Waterburya agarophytonicola]MCC0175622.1 CBS domain-containing protein [Waterburya agarophytonicola KI4]
MDIILCHQTVDFDALGSAIGLSRVKPGAKIVLTGGAHPAVKNFLALYKDEFTFAEMRSISPETISTIYIVDTQKSDRLGAAADWFDLPNVGNIEVYDHHVDLKSDIAVTKIHTEAVGAITTYIAELLQEHNLSLTTFEATAMALGIHVDTGSLTFDQSTPRDAKAIAWLMEQGANISIVSEYVEPGLSPQLQDLLKQALDQLDRKTIQGYAVASVMLKTDKFVNGLATLTARLIDLTESDVLLLGHQYQKSQSQKLVVIGRSRLTQTNLNQLFKPFGGGGHAQAASMSTQTDDAQQLFNELITQLESQIPHPPTARDLMSSPVRTIRPNTTIEQAQKILFRYGHSGVSVVDKSDRLVGIISRRDLDLALHHGFSHAPIKGYMSRNLKTITPNTTLPEIQFLMVTYDVGRLPVIEGGDLVGIVTRTDVLRQLHDGQNEITDTISKANLTTRLLPTLQNRLESPIWQLLQKVTDAAQAKGWNLYLVGGGVRDVLLTDESDPLLLQDIDLVVDGFHRSADDRAGVELAAVIQQMYPDVSISIHGEFQTAALSWHKDPIFSNLLIDIATARTEFYPYPTANPQVEASSIRQDLYRRDFTINALAVRLTPPKRGEFSRKGDLLDFFGGLIDLEARQIRVLHPNSFIEDPTRIYRAVRFAVRLGFTIEPQTEEYIHYAIKSGVYQELRISDRASPALTTRLRAELKYILQANYWKPALKLLAKLNALSCLHQDLVFTKALAWQVTCVSRWMFYIDIPNVQPWLIRLEILIAHLSPFDRLEVAENLQLPKDSLQRLQQLEILETEVAPQLLNSQLPSQIHQLLQIYKPLTLILFAARGDKNIRHILWQYITKLSQVKPLLTGNDLKKLGFKPGKLYKEILDDVLAATLDGKIRDRLTAEKYVLEHY